MPKDRMSVMQCNNRVHTSALTSGAFSCVGYAGKSYYWFLSFFFVSIRQILSSPLLIYVFSHPNWRYICIDITQIPKDFIFKAYETVNREIINLNSDIQNSHWIWNYFSIP